MNCRINDMFVIIKFIGRPQAMSVLTTVHTGIHVLNVFMHGLHNIDTIRTFRTIHIRDASPASFSQFLCFIP